MHPTPTHCPRLSSNMTPGSVEREETTKSLDMLRKIVRDTLKGGSQTIWHPDKDRSYWQKEEKEVIYNCGRTPHQAWEWDLYNGITHTQGTDKGPLERPNSVDPYEEHELVIDLDTDTDSSCQSEDTQPPVTLTPQAHNG